VSRTEVSAIETGRLIPSVAVALRLAAALGEPVERLFGESPAEPTAQWAWSPSTADGRLWRASVNGQVVMYPVERTAAGTVAHDGVVGPSGPDLSASDARPDRTLVLAGCDPIVALLVREIGNRHGIRVLPLLRSSTQALHLLRQKLVHVAGIHFTHPTGLPSNAEVVRASVGAGYRLIHQLQWEAGVAFDPARRASSMRALLRANLRWVNREEGSAARRAFDARLGNARPKGYDHVVTDHGAVVSAISSGWAEAGICVRPAAAEARLGFIPLQQEAYELCFAESDAGDPRLVALLDALRSQHYRRLIADVPGCLSRDTGEQIAVA
jgi:molybdate-binding protein/DNA-binding XRE family transcriptional regulator